MTIAIALLADQRHNKLEPLASFLSEAGLKVCIHVDGNGDSTYYRELKHKLSHRENIVFAKQIACGWGQFSLVEAELEMCRTILDVWPDVSHIQLISGDSLPIEPIARFQGHISENPDVDFIESVSVVDNNWVVGGLGMERFTLRFPFSWKKQRFLFDLWVSLQRKLHIRRRIPFGITPHIGSQWWCLTRETVAAILNDPDKPTYDSFFRHSWIPDESYFQTLARKHSRKIEAQSLLYSPFDHQGKPVTFYDDHADMLADTDLFFARKIWGGSDGLYRRFLGKSGHKSPPAEHTLSAQISKASARRKEGRTGLRMIGRSPNQWHEAQPATAASYQVLWGVVACYPNLFQWLEAKGLACLHDRLFAPDRAHFHNNTAITAGGISSNPNIRDYAPEGFLLNLVWQYRNEKPVFRFEPADSNKIAGFISRDPNAHVHLVEHGWLLDLAHSGIENPDLLKAEATRYLNRERLFIERLGSAKSRCKLTRWNIGEALSDPMPVLADLLNALDIAGSNSPMEMPTVASVDTAIEFAGALKNIGVDIDLGKLDSGIKNGDRSDIALVVS